jgi:hypothetical protein
MVNIGPLLNVKVAICTCSAMTLDATKIVTAKKRARIDYVSIELCIYVRLPVQGREYHLPLITSTKS